MSESEKLEPPPDGPSNHGPMMLGVMWGLGALTICIMLARLYTRCILRRMFGWDDGWMVFAWVMALLTNALDTVAIHHGLGQHMYYLSKEQRSQASFWVWVSFTPGNIWNGAGKIAFACTLLRIVVAKWQKWFLWTFLWQLLVLEIVQIVLNYAQCKPVEKLWDHKAPGTCWNPKAQQGFAIGKGAYIIIVDLILSLFPLLFIAKLNVPRKTKFALASLMCVGVFATICSILKTIANQNLSKRTDFTWEIQDLVIWFTCENYCTMIAGSIAILKPLYDDWRDRASSSMKRSTYSKGAVELSNQDAASKQANSDPKRKTPLWDLHTIGSPKPAGDNRTIERRVDVSIFHESTDEEARDYFEPPGRDPHHHPGDFQSSRPGVAL